MFTNPALSLIDGSDSLLVTVLAINVDGIDIICREMDL
jgi:hypothetical protein